MKLVRIFCLALACALPAFAQLNRDVVPYVRPFGESAPFKPNSAERHTFGTLAVETISSQLTGKVHGLTIRQFNSKG